MNRKQKGESNVVKERINEIVDFALTESPYKTTSKGWINDFIYLKLGKAKKTTTNEKEELASIAIHWNKFLALAIFLVAFIPAFLAFAFLTFF